MTPETTPQKFPVPVPACPDVFCVPVALTLNSSTGAITGTAPAATSETTYNFTLRATDAESQTADRAFSITISVGMNNSGQFIFNKSSIIIR